MSIIVAYGPLSIYHSSIHLSIHHSSVIPDAILLSILHPSVCPSIFPFPSFLIHLPSGPSIRESSVHLANDHPFISHPFVHPCIAYLPAHKPCTCAPFSAARKTENNIRVKNTGADICFLFPRKGQVHISMNSRSNPPYCNCVLQTLYWLVSRLEAGSPRCPVTVQLILQTC